MHGHTCEHPTLARFERPHSHAKPSNSSSLFADPFQERQPSPFEEGTRTPRAATTLPEPHARRYKHAARHDPGNSHPTIASLAGDPKARPPIAAAAVRRKRWTARAELHRVKGTAPQSLLPQDDAEPILPSSSELLGHPCCRCRRLFVRRGWMLPSSSGTDQGPRVQHRPTKEDTSSRTRVPSTTRNQQREECSSSRQSTHS